MNVNTFSCKSGEIKPASREYKMILSNYHSHFNLCDGKGEAHEYLDQAIKLGFSAYGFSAHAPLPDECWTMKEEDMGKYLQTVENLKKTFKILFLHRQDAKNPIFKIDGRF